MGFVLDAGVAFGLTGHGGRAGVLSDHGLGQSAKCPSRSDARMRDHGGRICAAGGQGVLLKTSKP